MSHATVPNTFAGKCIRCGERVEAEAGTHRYGKSEDSAMWPATRLMKRLSITQHLDCAAKYEGTNTHHIYHPIKENN
jgi:hypothetical protein